MDWLAWSLLVIYLHVCSSLPNYHVHAFYYTWYGSPEGNGKWLHWNHTLLKPNGANDGPTPYHPPDRVASAYYPALGPYSNLDNVVIETHLKQMAEMDVGVIAVSWWGRHGGDGQLMQDAPGYTNQVLLQLLAASIHTNIRIAIHIEPYDGRTAASVIEDIKYIMGLENASALLSLESDGLATSDGSGRPVFYIYDSYHISAQEWAQYLAPEGSLSIRGTPHDAVVLSLLVERSQLQFLVLDGHFDGFYTYFGTDGFSYGSTIANWGALRSFADRHQLLFCPCVGPGYDDLPLRPWNGRNSRNRQNGQYYDMMWAAALKARPSFIGITSWNEWGEGTQIEPAVPKEVDSTFRYKDYGPHGPHHYMDLTRKWSTMYRRQLLSGNEL